MADVACATNAGDTALREDFASELVIVARRWRTRLVLLAERAGVEPATLPRFIDLLEAQALPTRDADAPDRRVRTLRLRPAATPIIAEIVRVGDELRRHVLRDVARSELAAAISLRRHARARLDLI